MGVRGKESPSSDTSGLKGLRKDIEEPSLYARDNRSSTRALCIR